MHLIVGSLELLRLHGKDDATGNLTELATNKAQVEQSAPVRYMVR